VPLRDKYISRIEDDTVKPGWFFSTHMQLLKAVFSDSGIHEPA